MSKIYGLVKNNIVFNTVLIEGEQPAFIEILKTQLDADFIVPESEINQWVSIGQVYDPTTGILTYPPSMMHEPKVINSED
jgi:hypothetical protein